MSQIAKPAATRIRHKRTHQERLLRERAQLGQTWAEQISHAQPGAGKIMADLAHLEIAITRQWPNRAEQWLIEWTIADANKIHDPTTQKFADCALCQQTAAVTMAA